MKAMLLFFPIYDISVQYENPYHMFYFGCFLTILHDGIAVVVSSNREAGHGRYDIRIVFHNSRQVILFLFFEFKKSSSISYLDEDAESGLVQAHRNKYVCGYNCLLIGVSKLKYDFLQK